MVSESSARAQSDNTSRLNDLTEKICDIFATPWTHERGLGFRSKLKNVAGRESVKGERR